MFFTNKVLFRNKSYLRSDVCCPSKSYTAFIASPCGGADSVGGGADVTGDAVEVSVVGTGAGLDAFTAPAPPAPGGAGAFFVVLIGPEVGEVVEEVFGGTARFKGNQPVIDVP